VAKLIKRNGFHLSVIAVAWCLSITNVAAAGFGKITVFSPLGQPLQAEIDINATRDELTSMNARLASAEAFRQLGIEYAASLSGIRFAVDKRKDGQPYLRMYSDRAIDDPSLDVLVELAWSSGRIMREYTILLDPPEALTGVKTSTVNAPVVVNPVSTPDSSVVASASTSTLGGERSVPETTEGKAPVENAKQARVSGGVGFGKITVLSPMGQPLQAEIELNATRGDLASMSARIAPSDAFSQLGIEYTPSLSAIRFAIDERKDGQPYLRMYSDRAIDDPFLDVLVELTWSSGRIVREYTVLLDPPQGLPVAPVVTNAVSTPGGSVTRPAAGNEKFAQGTERTSAENTKQTRTPASVKEDRAAYKVKYGDTLSKIAAATKSEDISLDQMLVALVKRNGDAFESGNMNRLRTGKILTIPNAEEIAAVNSAEATRTVIAQARDFNAYRARLAAAVEQTPVNGKPTGQNNTGTITPNVASKPGTTVPGQDTVTISHTDPGKGTVTEADFVAQKRQLDEANSRVADLQKQVTDLNKLLELKNQTGGETEIRLDPTKTPPTDPHKPPLDPTSTPAGAPANPVSSPNTATASTTPITPPDTGTPSSNPVNPATEPPPDAPKPTDETLPSTDEHPQPTDSQLPQSPSDTAATSSPESDAAADDNSVLIYGSGGLLILLVVIYLIWRQRSGGGGSSLSEMGDLTDSELKANSVFGTTGGQAVDTSTASILADVGQATLAAAIDTSDEGVDPITEADLYIAYEKMGPAEEILLDALKSDPKRLAIYLKLLEIYSSQKDVVKFQKVAKDLKALTGGIGPEWSRAIVMGRAIDPANLLYSGGDHAASGIVVPPINPSASVAGTQGGATPARRTTEPAGVTRLNFDIGVPPAAGAPRSQPDFTLTLPAEEGHAASPAASVAPAAPPPALDFEFDLNPPRSAAAPTANKPIAATAAAPAPPAMDFSAINLDLPKVNTSVSTPDETANSSGSAVNTKLELAQAYAEMGERESQRELLEEVLREGDAAQQEVARTRLAALGA
jgi:pilus assembly protein FimV